MKLWKYMYFLFVVLLLITIWQYKKWPILRDFMHETHETSQVDQDISKEFRSKEFRSKEFISKEFRSKEQINKKQMNEAQTCEEQITEEQITEEQINQDQISKEMYRKNGIEANYPKFSAVDNEKQSKWNQILLNDFIQILNIYSLDPFRELTPEPTTVVPIILKIDYEPKINNKQFVSIFYKADFNSPYSAHPTDLVYTTNIDKNTDRRVRLTDMVEVNKNFVKEFRGWDLVGEEERNEEVNQAIKDYINQISDEDLLLGLQAADNIGSDNLWGNFSYLTQERLGISIEVPNYIGDHVEFEKNYSELKEYLKPNYTW